MTAWIVRVGGVDVDTLFFMPSMDEADVLIALAREGWCPSTEVRRG